LTRGLQAGSQREEAQTDARIDAMQAAVETPAADNAVLWQSFPKGARYGSLLHDLLEWQAQQGWPLAQAQSQADSPQQQAWQMWVSRKTRGLNLPQPALDMLPDWVRAIMSTPLPVAPHAPAVPPLVLSHLKPEAQWPEMEFNITVSSLAADDIDRWIQQQVLPGLTRPALQARVLQGMLTGFMDLVCEHAGRYWVLDYKSNWLADYDTESLNAAIVDKRYEVQYVLYVLALHRLLKSRLPGYDYDTHVGGAVYVFVRGIDSATAGVHSCKPPWALIDQLDRAFAGAPS
jgi:exodeoxyribonuclease V beta subunit